MADFGMGGHGPYPDDWSQAARDFWDNEPNTYRELYDDSREFEQLQNAFDQGWIATGISKEEHEQGRQEFYAISGTQESSFDWEAFREFILSIDTPN